MVPKRAPETVVSEMGMEAGHRGPPGRKQRQTGGQVAEGPHVAQSLGAGRDAVGDQP